MTRTAKIANLLTVVLPPLIIAAAIVVFWNKVVGLHDLLVALVMYLITGFGVTVGFHRMLTHRSFRTSKPVEYFFAAAGKGFSGAVRGLLHAHVGWLLTEHGRADRLKYARDLVEDRGMRFVDRAFVGWVLLGLAVPAALGWLLTGSYTGALTGLLWGGLVRTFLLHHVAWSINSVCHFFGRRRFVNDDKSTNVWWLALPSFGEAWHHNHHTFPRSAAHGLRRFEVDPSAAVIWAMEKLGLAWDVVRITPERQTQRLA
jgi:stearoyl-CoA desaturase (Delta-9 desaturase)